MFWFDFHWQLQHLLNQYWWQINFLLLIVIVLVGYWAYKKPIYAVSATIILLPTYLFRSQIGFLPFTFLELCILVTFGGWMIKKSSKFKVQSSRLRDYQFPALLIMVGATIGMLIAPDLRAAAGLWKAYVIEPLLFLIVLKATLQEEKDKRLVLWSLGAVALLVSLFAIYQKFTGFAIFEPAWTAPAQRRVTSFFSSPNAVGLFLGPIVALYLGWLLAEVNDKKAVLGKLAVMLPALLALVFTVSQGSWLGLAAAFVFLAFFGWSKKWTSAIIAVLIMICLAVPLTRHRLIELTFFQDAAGQNRLALWSLAGQVLTEQPTNFLLGSGILGFADIQDQTRDPLTLEPLLYPHNIILNFWLEFGLLGLVGFGLVILSFFKKGLQTLLPTTYHLPPNQWLTLGLMAAIVTIIIHGFFDVPYFKNDLALLFWLMVGLL